MIVINGSWIYNYLCNLCLASLKLRVPTQSLRGALDTTFCDKICQWLATGRWFSPRTPISSTNKSYCHDITEILLKVPLNTRNQPTTKKGGLAPLHDFIEVPVPSQESEQSFTCVLGGCILPLILQWNY